MWKTILDLLFPISCLGCGQEGEFICPNCFEKIPLKKGPLLKLKGNPALAGLLMATDYNHPLVRQAIHRYKYDLVKDLAKPLGQLMTNRLRTVLNSSDNIILIPIPLHKKRLRWRGFNQAELLALEISRQLDIPLANNIISRSKHSLPQAKIKSSWQRKQNIKKAFKLNSRFDIESYDLAAGKVVLERSNLELKNSLKNKTLILIDDVSTSGATLEECGQALKSLNPKQILGLVAAQG